MVKVVNHDTLEDVDTTYPVYFADDVSGTVEKYVPGYRVLLYKYEDIIQCEILRHPEDGIEIFNDMRFVESTVFEELFTEFKQIIEVVK